LSDLDPAELQLVEDDGKLALPLSCNHCGRAVPVRATVSFLDPSTGKNIRVFKCQCGRLIWDD